MSSVEFGRQLIEWRHHLHRHPETGFNETRTSQFIADELRALGLDVHRGVGGTGVVASLTVGTGAGTIGLRADMDALAITEDAAGRTYASVHDGCMHACGHDGHMSMLLGAARLLTERRDVDGTVRFVFQPAEEHGRGAAAMLTDGLLERFPMDEMYGLHNMPDMPAGQFAMRSGGIMASEDNFVIHITGRGGHAARPQITIDPLVIGAEIVLALQTVVARSMDPGESAVISCTEFIGDGIRNAIPTHVTIKGDTRSYSADVQALLERRIREIATGVCAAHGATVEVDYTHEFEPTINWPDCVEVAARAATAVAGADNVDTDTPPVMASEDFGAFLRVVPGAFVFIGNGDGNGVSDGNGVGVSLHNPTYDFNDEILPLGARFLAEVARTRLPG
jgi:amidohydrolase